MPIHIFRNKCAINFIQNPLKLNIISSCKVNFQYGRSDTLSKEIFYIFIKTQSISTVQKFRERTKFQSHLSHPLEIKNINADNVEEIDREIRPRRVEQTWPMFIICLNNNDDRSVIVHKARTMQGQVEAGTTRMYRVYVTSREIKRGELDSTPTKWVKIICND